MSNVVVVDLKESRLLNREYVEETINTWYAWAARAGARWRFRRD
jgi:hypothetical protein